MAVQAHVVFKADPPTPGIEVAARAQPEPQVQTLAKTACFQPHPTA